MDFLNTIILIIFVFIILSISLRLLYRRSSVKGKVHPKVKSPSSKPRISREGQVVNTTTMIRKQVSSSSDCISSVTVREDLEIGSDEIPHGEQGTKTDKVQDGENSEFDRFRSFIKKDELERKMADEGTTHGLYQYIKQSLDDWKKRDLNVAVTGNSGAGKSSLINALRKLKPSDKGAAKVDIVETTMTGQKYTYPENKHVALWDLPGIGTQTFTRDKYLADMDFPRFDVVIIVTATRFLENDVWLAKEILKMRKNVLFVRTKIDIDMMNAKRDHPDDFNEINCRDKIKDNIAENFIKGGIPASEIFLVSSPDRALYDFSALDKKLKSLLSIRGKAIRKILEEPIEHIVKTKRDLNKNEFKVRKAASVIYGFLPIPNLETGLGNLNASSMHELCLEKFCIDDLSLDKISNELNMSKHMLKKSLKSYQAEIRETQYLKTENKIWGTFRKYSKYIVPIVGMFLSAHKAYVTMDESLKTICESMAEDELLLIKLRLARLEEELRPL